MSIEERIRAIATRMRPVNSFCAVRQLSEKQQQDFMYRRLYYEYISLDEDKKAQWLYDKEAKTQV